MKWLPSWSWKGARENQDSFTPIVVAGAQESPRAQVQSLREPSASKRSPFVPIWQSTTSTRAPSTATSQNPRRSRLPGMGAFQPFRTWNSERSKSKESVHPQPSARGPAFASISDYGHNKAWARSSSAFSSGASPSSRSRLPGMRRMTSPRELSMNWLRSPRSSMTRLTSPRELSSPRMFQRSSPSSSFQRSCTSRAMSMDAFFDAVTAQCRDEAAAELDESKDEFLDTLATLEESISEKHGRLITPSTLSLITPPCTPPPPLHRFHEARVFRKSNLKKSDSKKCGDLVMPSASEPPLGAREELATEPRPRSKSSLTELPSIRPASISDQASTSGQEQEGIRMTTAQIRAWKARNRVPSFCLEGEEGVFAGAGAPQLQATSARAHQPLANSKDGDAHVEAEPALPLGTCVAMSGGDRSEDVPAFSAWSPQECAFWSMQPNTGCLSGPTSEPTRTGGQRAAVDHTSAQLAETH